MTNPSTVPGEGHTKGLSELLAKVQAASGPDRDLEYALVCHFFGEDEGLLHEIHGINLYRLTDSVDAALALVERVLPGWQVNMHTFGRAPVSGVALGGREACKPANAATLPLAILSAALQTLMRDMDEAVAWRGWKPEWSQDDTQVVFEDETGRVWHPHRGYWAYKTATALARAEARNRELEATLAASAGGEWVLVPREPTEAMMNEGLFRARLPDGEPAFVDGTIKSWDDVTAVYRAMLSASPQPPTPAGVREITDDEVERVAIAIAKGRMKQGIPDHLFDGGKFDEVFMMRWHGTDDLDLRQVASYRADARAALAAAKGAGEC